MPQKSPRNAAYPTLAEAAAGPTGEVFRGDAASRWAGVAMPPPLPHADDVTPELGVRLFWLRSRQQLDRKRYECIRVDGRRLCRWCKLPYYKHPRPEPELVPTLHVDCEGRRLKT